MWATEYQKAKVALPGLRKAVKDQKSLTQLLEALITAKGHAWCMDVKSERRKMAKLINKEIISLVCSEKSRVEW